jgi:hypothetical protein
MPPPPRRPDDRRPKPGGPDPFLSGMIVDAEVLDAEVLDAQVLDAEVLDADVLEAEVLDSASVEAVIEAEVLDAEPLPLGDGPAEEAGAAFDLELIDGPPAAATAPAASLPLYESLPSAPTGADLLSLDADPPRPAARTAARPATATRPAVRITFVCPGEQSPLGGRG